jgi:hypothetical protein
MLGSEEYLYSSNYSPDQDEWIEIGSLKDSTFTHYLSAVLPSDQVIYHGFGLNLHKNPLKEHNLRSLVQVEPLHKDQLQ